jgi:hypothetical protein
VARAIPPHVSVFRVPHLRSSWGDLPNHDDNVESYVRRICELLGKAERARVNRDWHQREALGLREQLGRYVAFFDEQSVTQVITGDGAGEGVRANDDHLLIACADHHLSTRWRQ